MSFPRVHLYKSNYTTAVLTSSDGISNRSLQKEILQLDLSLLLADASIHPSQQYVQAVASSNDGSWLKLWDLALERGAFGTTCVQVILRFLSTQMAYALFPTVLPTLVPSLPVITFCLPTPALIFH